MLIQDIILKKRNGKALNTDEINFFVKAYSAGEIPDYQASALLMAIWFNHMDERETTDLTTAIKDSGDCVDLSAIDGVKLDKHSTGGVADTTTLITAPLVAACGGRVAKISGRGLGHTGGTVDKLESVPGVNISRSMDELIRIVSACGLAVVSQSANLVPADQKLYALRDVTGTVDNISLISSSIMSKKLALGGDAIVLDVKTGNGAFMRQEHEAAELARMMVEIGQRAGKKTSALITDMNQPLGCAVGNALEVEEAIEILRGERDGDLAELSLALAAEMLVAGGLAADEADASMQVADARDSGEGLHCFARMIELLDGNPQICDDTTLLPSAAETVVVRSDSSGVVSGIRTADVGSAAMLLGAGRATKTDSIDPAVGLKLYVRYGDEIREGDEIGRLFVNNRKNLERAESLLKRSVSISDAPVDNNPLIYQTIRGKLAERPG